MQDPTKLPNFVGKLYTPCQDGHVFLCKISELKQNPITLEYVYYHKYESIKLTLQYNKEKNLIAIIVSLPPWEMMIPGKSGLFISYSAITEESN